MSEAFDPNLGPKPLFKRDPFGRDGTQEQDRKAKQKEDGDAQNRETAVFALCEIG